MVKRQPTSAQAARSDARAGGKYTTALREHRARSGAPVPVVQFLADGTDELRPLVDGVSASWAHSGLRVLLLQEAESELRISFPSRKGQLLQPVPAEPTTTVLWEQADGPGRLVRHICPWDEPAVGELDFARLQEAIATEGAGFDVVVLLQRCDRPYRLGEFVTSCVAVARVGQLPHEDCVVRTTNTGELARTPLSPEQCAAVLRLRGLRFLFELGDDDPIPLDGVIWRVRGPLPVTETYLAEVDLDMARFGVRTLAWSIWARSSAWVCGAPRPEQLADPAFVDHYSQASAQVRRVWAARTTGPGLVGAGVQPVSTSG
ncbi:hypothetical protein [Streptacidiphilus anmyonensis]|uniref:hypothetical protein n=1 Tax=Streptacidiphilus anmyonensis TaxID=405782 RepID=UPI000693CB80|nr:hypothetical protein [Streptacidiphilus anmyonensis]